MQTLQSANRYYQQQQQIAAVTAGATRKLWGRMTDDFSSSWASIARPMFETVQLGRAAAVTSSLSYTSAVLAETGQVAPAFGALNPERFLATAPNGQSMAAVLDGAVVQAKVAVKAGATSAQALMQAESWLTGVVLTNMSDTGRGVVGADIAQRPALTGYVRMLNAPSCSRCVILAGKWFRWNDGFLRHPRCDCRHIPAAEDVGGDLRTDPYAYFESLSKEAQEKTFGRIEARAIRDGGDINRVVNIKARGLGTAKSAKRYGTPTRMTVDDIYRTAGTRTNALRMLEEEGYITGPQVRGGNVLGQREGFGQFGKGGKGRAASDAVIEARVTGVRDPLNRYTMTAGERRLFDAKTRLDIGKTGIYPRSIGANTADKYVAARAITSGELAVLEKAYANELARLAGGPKSVRRLADLLEPKPVALPLAASRQVGDIGTSLKNANPQYSSGDGYKANCANSVTAFELRMRGRNVQALGVDEAAVARGGIHVDDFLAQFRTPDGKVPDLARVGSRTASEKALKESGEGSRAFVFVSWNRSYGGGGHVFSAVNDGGRVRFLDPQSGVEYPSDIFSNVKPKNVWLLRSDDLSVLDDLSGAVK